VSTAILEEPIAEAVSDAELIISENLATATEKLAALRFLIILTARTEASEATEPERRKHLRGDLARLRAEYFNKIDEIAMHHGVQAAMDAREDVECTITVPRGARLPMRREQAWF
jgi:hypothetical protein